MATCTIVCAWCGQKIRVVEAPDGDPSAGKESHGICKACAKREREKLEEAKRA